MTIDHQGFLPIYMQVAAWVRERQESGELAPGRPIPSKRWLRQELDVSAGSVERAYTVLRNEGRIATSMGRGLFTTPRDQWRG